jgi:signal transduction histidine kinase
VIIADFELYRLKIFNDKGLTVFSTDSKTEGLFKQNQDIGYDAQVKGIEFNFDLDLNIPTTLVGDPFRLGQIFGNLCSNALRFIERGQILIAVTIVDKSKEKITLRFSVKDIWQSRSRNRT